MRDYAFCFLQGSLCFCRCLAGFAHYQREGQVTICFREDSLSRLIFQPRFRLQNAQGARMQLDIARLHICHAIAGHITEADHGRGGDHIEHQLLRRSGF